MRRVSGSVHAGWAGFAPRTICLVLVAAVIGTRSLAEPAAKGGGADAVPDRGAAHRAPPGLEAESAS